MGRQGGAASTRQLRDVGVTRRMVDRRVDAGDWVRRHPGVVVDRAAPASAMGELHAAVLALGLQAAISHRSAAWLQGLLDRPRYVDVTVDRPRSPQLDGVLVHRSLDLAEAALVRRRGLLITGPARTLVDLGAVAPDHAVAEAVHRAVAARLVTRAELWAELERLSQRGRRGVGVLRRVLDGEAPTPPGSSVLESRFGRIVRAAGLPMPTFQLPVAGGRFILDAAWEPVLVCAETDGFLVHGAPESLSADLERQNWLVEHGWTVLRFTHHHVTRRPSYVSSRLAGTLLPRYAELKATS